MENYQQLSGSTRRLLWAVPSYVYRAGYWKTIMKDLSNGYSSIHISTQSKPFQSYQYLLFVKLAGNPMPPPPYTFITWISSFTPKFFFFQFVVIALCWCSIDLSRMCKWGNFLTTLRLQVSACRQAGMDKSDGQRQGAKSLFTEHYLSCASNTTTTPLYPAGQKYFKWPHEIALVPASLRH